MNQNITFGELIIFTVLGGLVGFGIAGILMSLGIGCG